MTEAAIAERTIELLPATEQEALDRHEATIERGITAFWEVGDALAAIRDDHLYRATHATFADYCADRWGFSRARAYQLIGASEVARELSTMVDITTLSERQTRELARAAPADRPAVLTRAAEQTNGKPTAKAIRHAAAEIKPPAAPRLCEHCGGPWGAPGSMVTNEGRLCPGCSAARLSSGQPFASPTTTTTAIGRCACGKDATGRENIGGVSESRCDACAIRAERDDLIAQLGDQYRGIATDRGDPLDGRTHRIAWARGGGGDYFYREVLERLTREPGRAQSPADPALVALCERAEALGAQINYLALSDPAIVRVVPPPGYQQRPLDCDAADLGKLVAAWEHPPTTKRRSGREWWDVVRERAAFEAAMHDLDQLRAARAAAALTIAVAGDATRMALAQAERGAVVLEAEGLASLASVVRMLIGSEATI